MNTYDFTIEELANLLYDATIEWGADARNLETYEDALAFAETLKEDGDVLLTELTPEDYDFDETCEKLNVLGATERVYTFVKGNAGSICFADDIHVTEKKDIFVYADENHLDVVRTTDNERALVHFEDFEAAERAADEVGGIVSLICRRDGERLWSNQGWTDKPIEFDDSFIDCNQHLYIYDTEEEFRDYFLGVFSEKIDERCELDELVEFSTKGREAYDALCSMDEDEVLIYYPFDHSYAIRKRYDTIVSYDTMTYEIAVVVKSEE